MRWSLETKFHARHYTINIRKTTKNCFSRKPKLDAYLLPCVFSNDNEREDEAIKKYPTIII